jgi:hypothetical protein
MEVDMSREFERHARAATRRPTVVTRDEGSASAPAQVTQAELDATLADSFPASDPPSWTLGIARLAPEPRRGAEDDSHRNGTIVSD